MSGIEEFRRSEALAAFPDTGCDWSSFYRGWLAAADKHNRIVEQYKRDVERMRLLEGLLSDAKDLIERGDFSEGYCMCGDSVDWHGLGYGHAPTDAGEYYAAQLVGNIDAALNQQQAEGE